MYGNASLSYYDPETKRVENEVFARANAQKLGDVAQSMTMHGGLGWIVVNNSGVIFAIETISKLCTGINHRRNRFVAAENYKKIADHSSALRCVKIYTFALIQTL